MPQGIPYVQPQFYRPRENGGGGFVPTDIPGCVLWLSDTGLDESTWPNLAGGADALQADSAKQPEIGIGQGSLQTRIYTSGDVMVAAVAMPTTATIFVVKQSTALASYQALVDNDDVSAFLGTIGSTREISVLGGSGNSATEDWEYWTAVYPSGGTDSNLSVDGALQFTQSVTRTTQSNTFIGNAGNGFGPFVGSISEVIIYDSELSPTDIGLVETYIATKYGF
jgi:hypothetical protein